MKTSGWPSIRTDRFRGGAAGYALFAIVYTGLIFAGRHLTLYEGTGPPVAWPAAGLLFAAFLITTPSAWPLLSLISAVSIAAAHILSGIVPVNVPIIVVSVCVPSALGAALLAHLDRRDASDDDLAATALVLVGGFLVPALIATCFAGFSAYRDSSVGRLYFSSAEDGLLGVWRDHFAGPSLGILTITPFAVAIARAARARVKLRPRAVIGDLLILAVTCAIAACFFEVSGLPLELRSPSIIMPIIVLISLRGKMILTTAVNLIVSWVMIGATLRGHGPFAAFFDTPVARTTVLQVFVAINVFSQTVFTAIIAGRAKLVASFRARGEELERLNEDLVRAKEEASRASELKSRVLADVTHEIRTPLGAMIGFAELALETPPAEKDQYIEIVRRNGVRLNELLNHTLDLSKIEAGHFAIDRRTIDPRELTAEVVDLMQIKAREKKIALQIVHGPDLPVVFCSDPLRVRQVLMNLIGNAIKFTPAGRVTVRVRATKTAAGRAALEFEVADTGIGLSAAEQKFLFQAYRQADATTAGRFGGTGLGLNLSRQLARLLDGDVELESSRPGHGTTFLFRITELKSDARPTPPVRPAGPAPAP